MLTPRRGPSSSSRPSSLGLEPMTNLPLGITISSGHNGQSLIEEPIGGTGGLSGRILEGVLAANIRPYIIIPTRLNERIDIPTAKSCRDSRNLYSFGVFAETLIVPGLLDSSEARGERSSTAICLILCAMLAHASLGSSHAEIGWRFGGNTSIPSSGPVSHLHHLAMIGITTASPCSRRLRAGFISSYQHRSELRYEDVTKSRITCAWSIICLI